MPCVFEGFTGNYLQVVRAVGNCLSAQADGSDSRGTACPSRRFLKINADDFARGRRPRYAATAGKSDGAVDHATEIVRAQIRKRKQVLDRLQCLPPFVGIRKLRYYSGRE